MNYLDTHITIKSGLLDSLGELIAESYPGKKIMLVSDETVYAVYGPKIEQQIRESNAERYLLILPMGENSKTPDSLTRIYNELLRNRFTREDVIIAFGGGAVGDVAGMAASTYLRGIPLIQIPTTLIAQADSSLGGKNGINLPEGKNLIGTFYHPEYIWIDPLFLNTLSEQHFAGGMAEVIKYACIADQELFDNLLSIDDIHDPLVIESIIKRCVEIKINFIEEDEFDFERRMILNFGHTIGHGLEQYYDYDEYSHGEAVAIGMQTLTNNSERLGLSKINTAAMLKELLDKYSLPTSYPDGIDKKRLFDMTLHDKKHRGEQINLILLKKIGSPFIHVADHADLKDFI